MSVAVLIALTAPATAEEAARDVATERMLRERDARIQQLEARLERLESRLGAIEGSGVLAVSPPGQRAASSSDRLGPPPERSITDDAARPGGLDVDLAAAERALERTLSNEGSLLLPTGKADVTPFVTYEYGDRSLVRDIVSLGGDAVVDTIRVRRDEITSGVTARLGLPYDAQIEATVPVVVAREDARRSLPITVQNDRLVGDDTGFGLGNVRVGVAKTLLRENGFLPDVIGRVTYSTASGTTSDNGVNLSSNSPEIGGSLTLLKRQDPLAFSLSAGYRHAFENDDVKPGSSIDLSAGAFLATSPSTALSLALSTSFQSEAEFDGTQLPGTKSRQAVASFGVSSVLHRNVLVNFNVGVGLTDDSPDFSATLSLPVRFGVW